MGFLWLAYNIEDEYCQGKDHVSNVDVGPAGDEDDQVGVVANDGQLLNGGEDENVPVQRALAAVRGGEVGQQTGGHEDSRHR